MGALFWEKRGVRMEPLWLSLPAWRLAISAVDCTHLGLSHRGREAHELPWYERTLYRMSQRHQTSGERRNPVHMRLF